MSADEKSAALNLLGHKEFRLRHRDLGALWKPAKTASPSFTGRMGTTLGDQWVPPERLGADCSTTLGIKPVRRLDSRPLRDCRADQGRIHSLSGPGPMFR